jgi:hypothetical protein
MIRGELKTYEGYVAIKRDNDGIYTLKKGNDYLTVDKDKFQEITAPERFRQKFDEKTPGWQKIIKSQYEDFFAQRENTSYNFRHNLAVYCRREANSPCDAIKIAKKIIEKMPLPEQKKIKKMLNSMKHEGETINQLIARNYHEAIKEIPLHENYIKKFRPENRIARPFYDTITENGQKLENDPKLIRGDRDFNLKIGDSIKNIDISTEKLFGKGTEKIKFAELIVISASREGNTITLMDRNKSFIEVPRDTLLQAYKQQQMQEIKHSQDRKRNSVEISYN